jgi:hypothetical protein
MALHSFYDEYKYNPPEQPPKPEIPWWAFPVNLIHPLPTTSYLKPGWDEKAEWGVEAGKVETVPGDSKLDLMKKSRRMKVFTINTNDFTALLQGNCWLRCKGIPKGATVTSSGYSDLSVEFRQVFARCVELGKLGK